MFFAIAIALAGAGPEFQRTTIGASYNDLSVLKVKPPSQDGALIMNVLGSSPAAKAKMGPLDVVTYVGTKRVHSAAEARDAMAACKPGKPLTVKGFKARPSESGRPKWSQRSWKVTPATLGECLLAGVEKTRDAVTEMTFYRDAESPPGHDSTEAIAYFGVDAKGGIGPLRLKLTFRTDEWLFIRSYTVKAGDQTFTIKPEPLAVSREVVAAPPPL